MEFATVRLRMIRNDRYDRNGRERRRGKELCKRRESIASGDSKGCKPFSWILNWHFCKFKVPIKLLKPENHSLWMQYGQHEKWFWRWSSFYFDVECSLTVPRSKGPNSGPHARTCLYSYPTSLFSLWGSLHKLLSYSLEPLDNHYLIMMRMIKPNTAV